MLFYHCKTRILPFSRYHHWWTITTGLQFSSSDCLHAYHYASSLSSLLTKAVASCALRVIGVTPEEDREAMRAAAADDEDDVRLYLECSTAELVPRGRRIFADTPAPPSTGIAAVCAATASLACSA